MWNVERDVHADAALLEACALRAQIRRAAAVRVQRDRRDALREQLTALLQGSFETLGRVRMHVDETGRHRSSLGIDHTGRRGVSEPAHVDDPSAANADVGGDPRITAPVEHAAVANQNVVRRRTLCER